MSTRNYYNIQAQFHQARLQKTATDEGILMCDYCGILYDERTNFGAKSRSGQFCSRECFQDQLEEDRENGLTASRKTAFQSGDRVVDDSGREWEIVEPMRTVDYNNPDAVAWIVRKPGSESVPGDMVLYRDEMRLAKRKTAYSSDEELSGLCYVCKDPLNSNSLYEDGRGFDTQSCLEEYQARKTASRKTAGVPPKTNNRGPVSCGYATDEGWAVEGCGNIIEPGDEYYEGWDGQWMCSDCGAGNDWMTPSQYEPYVNSFFEAER